MSEATRDGMKTALLFVWGLALVIGWITPDDDLWVAVRALLAGLWTVLLVAFVVGWSRARRAGDPTAQLDARLVLALGAIVALGAGAGAGAGVVVEDMFNSTNTATIVVVILLLPALGAYLYVAARAGQRAFSPDSR